MQKFAKIYEKSFIENWDLPALSEYTTRRTLTYARLAEEIAMVHLLYESIGLKQGDKVALCGKDSIAWVTIYMATVTYGAVVVPILSEFNPVDITHIVNHSEAHLLFVGNNVWEHIEPENLLRVKAAISLDDKGLLYEAGGTEISRDLRLLRRRFRRRYPRGFTSHDISYTSRSNDEVAEINYTSGTTGFSKGVMLTGGNLAGNVTFGMRSELHFRSSRALAFLPLAHAYGCAFDMLTPLAVGSHITLLCKVPSPRVLIKAMAEVRPHLVICVPLILEKIYKNQILPLISKGTMRWTLAVPFLDSIIYSKIRKKLIDAFGGNFEEVIVGGAPLNHEVEEFLHKIKFPFTVGYGMTECGPLISYTPWREFIPGSSGRVLPGVRPAGMTAEAAAKADSLAQADLGDWWTESWYKAVDDGYLNSRDLGTGQMARDQTVFVDPADGKAYHIFSSEDNLTLVIAGLSDDFTSHSGKYVRVAPAGHNEAPAIFRQGDTLWMITSGCTGWAPNKARMFSAKDIYGPWTQHENPCVGPNADLTFGGQSTYILTIPGTDKHIFMADIWRPEHPSDARYIWLPITWSKDGKPEVQWRDSWTLADLKNNI